MLYYVIFMYICILWQTARQVRENKEIRLLLFFFLMLFFPPLSTEINMRHDTALEQFSLRMSGGEGRSKNGDSSE